MDKVRGELDADTTWNELTIKCYHQKIELTASGSCSSSDLAPYTVWGVCCAEVEVDILTGTFVLKRVDILEDIGQSISPGIDAVQVFTLMST